MAALFGRFYLSRLSGITYSYHGVGSRLHIIQILQLQVPFRWHFTHEAFGVVEEEMPHGAYVLLKLLFSVRQIDIFHNDAVATQVPFVTYIAGNEEKAEKGNYKNIISEWLQHRSFLL
jgi:hypothetical protein